MQCHLVTSCCLQVAKTVKHPANLGSIILRRLEGFSPNIFSELHIDAELMMLACICFEISSDSSAANQLINLFVLKRIDLYISHKCFDLLGRVWSCACRIYFKIIRNHLIIKQVCVSSMIASALSTSSCQPSTSSVCSRKMRRRERRVSCFSLS